MIVPAPVRELTGDFRVLRVARRWEFPDRTLGVMDIITPSFTAPLGFTLEDPWGKVADGNGRIPAGRYRLGLHQSETHGPDTLHLLDVPGRKWILVHVGNYPTNTRGCILAALGVSDTQPPYVTSSKVAIATLKRLLVDPIKRGQPCYCLVEDNFDV